MIKQGFTLAEVLITLVIVGVVAALTIPTLINNYQKKQTLVRLLKAYSTLANAIKLSSIENGSPNEWDWDDGEDILKEKLGKYLKVSKYYFSNNPRWPLCHEKQVTFYDGVYTYGWLTGVHISNPFSSNNYSLLTNDGICIGPYKGVTLYENFIFVDINSSNTGPNMAGKDLFLFYIDTETDLLQPYGYKCEDIESANTTGGCNKSSWCGGHYCAAKIMRDGWKIADDYPW